MEFSGRPESFGVAISIVPDVAVSRPARMRSSVVLPQPDGPTIMKNSPGSIATETWSMATRLPKVLCRLPIRMAGGAEADAATARRLVALALIPGHLAGQLVRCQHAAAPAQEREVLWPIMSSGFAGRPRSARKR